MKTYRLASGVRLRELALVDDVLRQRHILNAEAKFALTKLLETQDVSTVIRQYAKKFKMSQPDAFHAVCDLLVDLKRHYLLETNAWITKRHVLNKISDLRKLAWVILATQWMAFVLPAFSIAIVGWSLGLPFLLMMFVLVVGGWIVTTIHESGHAFILLRSGQNVVVWGQRLRLRLLYDHTTDPKLISSATYGGPTAAAWLGVFCLVIAAWSGQEVRWGFVIVGIFGIGQLVHLLSWFEDGRTLAKVKGVNT